MIGTYPSKMIERLEKDILFLEQEVRRLEDQNARMKKVIDKWGLTYEIGEKPLDKSEKYVGSKVRGTGLVEGEGPMGYYGDV